MPRRSVAGTPDSSGSCVTVVQGGSGRGDQRWRSEIALHLVRRQLKVLLTWWHTSLRFVYTWTCIYCISSYTFNALRETRFHWDRLERINISSTLASREDRSAFTDGYLLCRYAARSWSSAISASWCGVLPYRSFVIKDAPPATSVQQMERRLFWAALCKAVCPLKWK